MSRDLSTEIDTLLRHSNPYIRKKAAMCAARLFEKCPDTIEDFIDRIGTLINDRNHGVLLAGLEMVIKACLIDPQTIKVVRRLVPKLVKRLKRLLQSGYQPEYDVSGITDPFVQIKILELLRICGEHSAKASEQMSDILANVATNTETNKNVGNAILYECVQTIMTIESESGLRVLAVTILARFLLNRDNNIRYVALNTLSKLADRDISTVNRHRQTIVDCMKDADVTIRTRALELVFVLANSSNIRVLAREMLNYLVVCGEETKEEVCSKVAEAVTKFKPSSRWYIDTMITLLGIGGDFAHSSIRCSFVGFITRAPELHSYAVHKLFQTISADSSLTGLYDVGTWSIGEYGGRLFAPLSGSELPPSEDGEEEERFDDIVAKTPSEVFALTQGLLKSFTSTKQFQALGLTTMLKLHHHTRSAFGSGNGDANAACGNIVAHLQSYTNNVDIELQQRAAEYVEMLSGRWDAHRVNDGATLLLDHVLEQMPAAIEREEMDDDEDDRDEFASSEDEDEEADASRAVKSAPAAAPADDMDLLGDMFGGGSSEPAAAAASPAAASGGLDLMGDLFGSGAAAAAPPVPAVSNMMGTLDSLFSGGSAAPAPAMGGGDLLGAMGGMSMGGGMGMGMAAPPAAASQFPAVQAYSRGGVTVMFSFSKSTPASPECVITATATNANGFAVPNYQLQISLPKVRCFQISPPPLILFSLTYVFRSLCLTHTHTPPLSLSLSLSLLHTFSSISK